MTDTKLCPSCGRKVMTWRDQCIICQVNKVPNPEEKTK